ncbi:DUF6152 family protein [Azospirillum sp. ST 5-10]|uniref:DUF6152 family protein n=1 Tax=unclassified Azospirillum TaxID=2630922 RepID=UPI003F49F0FA
MTTPTPFRRLLPVVPLGALLLATAAHAHHGWSWAEEEQTELSGTIRDVYVGPPHPALKVEAADGTVWTVELANPRQTERSGFTADAAAAGDAVRALGNRSSDPKETRMKAVRITVRDKTYDLYPERIRGN